MCTTAFWSICNFGLQIWIKYVIPKFAFKNIGVSYGLGNSGTALQDKNCTQMCGVMWIKYVINFPECLKLFKAEQLCSRIAFGKAHTFCVVGCLYTERCVCHTLCPVKMH